MAVHYVSYVLDLSFILEHRSTLYNLNNGFGKITKHQPHVGKEQSIEEAMHFEI